MKNAWVIGGALVASWILLRPARLVAQGKLPGGLPGTPAAHTLAVTEDRLRRGCPEAPYPTPGYVYDNARVLLRYLNFVESLVGTMPERGWWRPPECNARRDGVARSRHLEGAAVDVDPSERQRSALRVQLVQDGTIPDTGWTGEINRRTPWGDRVRHAIGVDTGVGLIVYRSGGLHLDVGCLAGGAGLCDPRSLDYIKIS